MKTTEKGLGKRQSPTILLIEDDPSFAAALSMILKRGGFEVCVAADGAQGLSLAEVGNFDVIISDVDLPNLDGFEICRKLKGHSKLRTTPIILMSGRLAEDNEPRALEMGAAAFLSKPFPAALILAKISSLTHYRNGPD